MRLAFHLDPEAWRPLYADIEVGRYRGLAHAMATAHKPPRKNAKNVDPIAVELSVRRLQSMLQALEYDTPTGEVTEELTQALLPYRHRAVPPNLP